jgi:hypothetical protein
LKCHRLKHTIAASTSTASDTTDGVSSIIYRCNTATTTTSNNQYVTNDVLQWSKSATAVEGMVIIAILIVKGDYTSGGQWHQFSVSSCKKALSCCKHYAYPVVKLA